MNTVNLDRAGLERWFGPMPGRREAQAMAWMALAMGVILCGVSELLGFEGRTFLGRSLGGDFVEFCTIGKILNHDAPARVYDLALATSPQHASLPSMPEAQMPIFGQAPFIIALSAVRAAAVRKCLCGLAGVLGRPLTFPVWLFCSARCV